MVACRYLLELSEAETVAVTGWPAGTVKSRLSRALGNGCSRCLRRSSPSSRRCPMPDSTRPGSIDVEALLADLAAHLEWPAAPGLGRCRPEPARRRREPAARGRLVGARRRLGRSPRRSPSS